MTQSERLKALIPRLAGQRVLVLGDVVLDEYIVGNATRMSREAPVPVLEYQTRQLIPGGAANPAANIAALGSLPVQVGIVGADGEATALRQVLQALGIETTGLVTDPARPTTVKTRLLAYMGLRFPQQVARLDRLSREPISPDIERQVRALLSECIPAVSAVLVSDYQVGLLAPSLVETIRTLADDAGVLLTVDSQGHLEKYAGFGLVKCNADEARAHLHRDLRGDDDFAEAAVELYRSLALTRAMVITRGADGATAAMSGGEVIHCPSPVITDVYDTVGAGDTSIAVLTLSLLAGATVADATMLANYASGLVVRRVGNYQPRPEELLQAVERR